MIVKSVLLAWLLSQPIVEPTELDMSYKPCVELYNSYTKIQNQEQKAIMGENLRYLCTPIKYTTNE